jgi:hypothetical protein
MDIFNKKIIIDEEAAERILNANTVSVSDLKHIDKNKINNIEELIAWFGKLKGKNKNQ